MTNSRRTMRLQIGSEVYRVPEAIFHRAARGIERKAVLRNPIVRWEGNKCFVFTPNEYNKLERETGPIDLFLQEEISEKVKMSTRLSKMRNRRLVMEANPVKSRKR